MTPEITFKLEKLRGLLDRLGLDAVLLRKHANFAWATGGARNYISIAGEIGAAALLITRERQFVLCNNIEALRMAAEERVEDLGYTIQSFPWHQDREAALARELAGKGAIGCDAPFADFRVIGSDIAPLRFSLTQWEVARYREVGFMTARAIEDAARSVRPGDKECAIVGRLASHLWDNGLDYITIFCAADDRISKLRHPIATDARVDKRAMLSVNARKWGLIVSLTRFVQFGPVPAEIRRRYDATVRVDCAMMAATIPGRPAREVFDTAIAAYAAEGFPGEHELHHQGGAIGYEGRDYKVTFDTAAIIQENQGFTWNPSITGAKSEDTMLATSHGPDMLSPPVTFPTLDLTVGGHRFRRPDILTL